MSSWRRGDAGPPTTEVDDGGRPGAPSLLLVVGAGTCSTHPLDGDRVIGRGADCDVTLDHPALSRRHARLRLGPPATIEDLGSTNGTRLGEAVLRGGPAVPLGPSDTFRIGPFSFVLMTAPGAAAGVDSLGDAARVNDPSADRVSPLVRDLAASPANVIVLGETGVGKEVLAETLHALSGRNGALVRLNCAALSEPLLESELFGHDKGAFTGAVAARAGLIEAAAGGTVFLDEIGELPAAIQAKLLRAIERREVVRLGTTRPIAVDVRFIAATNRDLPTEVAAGRFRRDLYFRLDGMTLVIPPLRERRALIGRLALGFLAAGGGDRAPRLDADALAALEAYRWPGNVRELRAVMERAVLLARGGAIGVRHLAFTRDPSAAVVTPASVAPAVPTPDVLEDGLTAAQRDERARIIAVLAACAGNQTRAAQQLGLPRTTLASKLALYRIPRPRT